MREWRDEQDERGRAVFLYSMQHSAAFLHCISRFHTSHVCDCEQRSSAWLLLGTEVIVAAVAPSRRCGAGGGAQVFLSCARDDAVLEAVLAPWPSRLFHGGALRERRFWHPECGVNSLRHRWVGQSRQENMRQGGRQWRLLGDPVAITMRRRRRPPRRCSCPHKWRRRWRRGVGLTREAQWVVQTVNGHGGNSNGTWLLT